ncbi:MAG: sensor domain-containing protein, partial [Methyloligellaceae bacterium]
MSKQIPSKLMLKLVLDALPVRIFWKDTDLTYLGCNQHFADDAGVKSPADLEGYCDFDFFEKDIADLFREDDRIVMDTGIPKVGYEEPQANPGGETRWLRTNKVPLKDLSGEIVGVLGTYEDITEQKLLRQKIERMAHEDELTGLPNRNQFKKSLDAAIERLKEPDHLIGLLLLDLDNFKNVNDTLGHLVGDKLLQVIADRIRENLPENSIAARLGGDEFAFIFSDLQSPEMIIKFAKDISSAIEEPINIDDHLLNVGASMGLITHSDSECSPHELFKNADIALYEAKREGKSDYCIYDSSMNIKVQLNQKIENDLCSAIRNGELYTLYQPQVCLQTGNVVGAETLLRWKHPELGMISPDTFITVAESKNIIIDIGYYVLEQACTFCSELNNKSDSPITVSVNLSLSQFKDRGLQENILDEVLKSVTVRPDT